MKVAYSFYELTPIKKANRFSSPEKKMGVLLKGTLGQKTLYADYFPHVPLGDKNCEEFLSTFKYQDDDYEQAVFRLMLKDDEFQKLDSKRVLLHQLWTGEEKVEAPIIKYKVQDQEDYRFLEPLKNGIKVRLDGNALFNRNEFQKFVNEIDPALLKNIEFIEDPLENTDWKDLPLPCAKDFIKGTPHQFVIYKPNCEKLPVTDLEVIFSPYLGGPLGTWHAYSELIRTGDLSKVHGMKSQGFYQEEAQFLTGSYQSGFEADQNLVKKIYQNVYSREWKDLCSM